MGYQNFNFNSGIKGKLLVKLRTLIMKLKMFQIIKKIQRMNYMGPSDI